jgi:hypothetical protein
LTVKTPKEEEKKPKDHVSFGNWKGLGFRV